jgi:hypothetical protein
LQSEEAIQALWPFLYENTELFIHELVSFARSPFDMKTYDRTVQYDWPHSSRHQQSSQERKRPREPARDASSIHEGSSSQVVRQPNGPLAGQETKETLVAPDGFTPSMQEVGARALPRKAATASSQPKPS